MKDITSNWILSVVLPLLAITIILVADSLEGPKTAYVGVLAVVPMLAAVFGTPVSTAAISILTLFSAATFGFIASDGNAPAQNVRLVIITIVGVIAVWAARQRQRSERERAAIQIDAARADVLERQSNTDSLTGLLNRRGLEAATLALPHPTFFIMIDVDGLKKVNDSYGHVVGDEYLTAIAGRLGNAFTDGCAIGRWGGDEFVVLSHHSADEIEEVVTRGVEWVTQREIHTQAGLVSCSISTGITPWREQVTIQEVMMAADQAMFEAKKRPEGRSIVLHN